MERKLSMKIEGKIENFIFFSLSFFIYNIYTMKFFVLLDRNDRIKFQK